MCVWKSLGGVEAKGVQKGWGAGCKEVVQICCFVGVLCKGGQRQKSLAVGSVRTSRATCTYSHMGPTTAWARTLPSWRSSW
eukprot:scaffold60416_cov21-Tisochrysis_lutea.AAC.1